MIRSMSTLGVTVLMVASCTLLTHCSSNPSIAGGDAGTDAGATDAGPGVTDAGVDAGPTDAGPDRDPAKITAETTALGTISTAFNSFHTDTGGWPWGESVWFGSVGPNLPDGGSPDYDPQVEPGQFTDNDKALFSDPTLYGTTLAMCSGDTHPCWHGPYLHESGATSMGSSAELDAWGNARLFALIRPFDGFGGGDPNAPHGAVVIWSLGPDGIDQTGCSTTAAGAPGNACALDYSKLATGHMSDGTGDDIIVVVTTATDN